MKCAEAVRLSTSKASASWRVPIFLASRSGNSSTTGMCTDGAVPLPGLLCSLPSCQFVFGVSWSFHRLPDSIPPPGKPFSAARNAATLPPNPDSMTTTS